MPTPSCVVDPHWDSDPAFYLTTDPDLDPGQTLLSQKAEFLLKNILM
jgi:hypothetical protein